MGSAASSQPIVVVSTGTSSTTNQKKQRRRSSAFAGFGGRKSKKDSSSEQQNPSSVLLIQCILSHKYEEASIMLARNNTAGEHNLAATKVLVKVGAVSVYALPLHVACAQPSVPLEFCQRLLNAYPEALLTPTLEGEGSTTTFSTDERNTSASHRSSLRRRTMDLVSTVVVSNSERSKQRATYANNNHSNHSSRSLGSHLSASGQASLDNTSSEGTTSRDASASNLPTVTATNTPDMAIGWFPLHVACVYNTHSIDLLELLLNNGGNGSRAVYCKTAQGMLPLHLACISNTSSTGGRSALPAKQYCSRLLQTFPESRFIPISSSSEGKMPLELWKETHGADKMEIPRELLLVEGGGGSGGRRGRGGRGSDDDGLEQQRLPTTAQQQRRFVHNMPIMMSSDNNTNNADKTDKKKKNKKSKTNKKGTSSSTQPLTSPFVPTPLYSAILAQDWDLVSHVLRKQPRLAQVWTCSSATTPSQVHLLPLHLAVQEQAPPNILKTLVLLYPKAVCLVEYMGRNVLHSAACSGSSSDDDENNFKSLQAILEAAPKSVLKRAASTSDVMGLLPIHALAQNERTECTNVAAMQRLLNAYPDATVTASGSNNSRSSSSSTGTPLELVKSHDSFQGTLLELLQRGTPYWLAPSSPPRGSCMDFLWTRRNSDPLQSSGGADILLERLDDHPEEASAWYRVPTTSSGGKRMTLLHYICMNHAAQMTATNSNTTWKPVLDKILQISQNKALSTPCYDEFNMYPLHLAIQYGGATPALLQYLLEAFPGAARHADAMGLLPLHLACSCDGAPHPTWIRSLIEAFPASLQHQDARGNKPNVYAEANAHHPNSKRIVELVSTTA
eukprot:CAMPEP_0194046686 /NCGR_PEP_ID=MMETSP0009_2-20130614/22240_1 /TAXON_ID=210454 /ORGANISM="Grammatophora oceanica, Strain CCMP 410" /LENGTH=844 /DNA_ID=CAMNT_0038692081 /DNA_START=157 /DNA_END=2691 /DNA_ORIENTATION=+